jgi:hypothetical protein
MRKNIKGLLLSSLLLFYAFLYIATQKKCDDQCRKMDRIDRKLSADTAINGTYQCRTDMLCVYVNDSLSRNWTAVADTACSLLNNEGLQNYTVAVLSSPERDTLVKQKCP